MRAIWKIVLLMLWCTSSIFAADDILQKKDEVKRVYEFKGKDAINGWGKTSTLTMMPKDECLELQGNGWDSKMYRQIDLQPGYYLLTATGKGQNLHIRLAKDLSQQQTIFDMNLTHDDWRTDWRPFTIDKPMRIWLLIHLASGNKVEAMVKQIKIEQAQEVAEAGIPPVAELEKQRPQPAIVRGCTCPAAKAFPDLHTFGGNAARTWISLKPESYTADGLAEYGPGWEKQLDRLETYLQAARDARMKVILTIGGETFGKNISTDKFWNNPGLPAVVCKVWRGIAERLLPYRDVIYGYDLYNEPLDWSQMPNAPRQWRDIAKNVIKAIREVDKETWLVYETGPGGLSWGFAGMKPLPDSRIIYSVHFYNPHEFTHQGIYNIKGTDLAEVKAKTGIRYPVIVNGLLWNKEQIKKDLEAARQFQLKYHVPILVGEFSVVRWAPGPDAVQYLTDLIDIFEEYQWSWIYHGFRECHVWSVEHDETFGRVEDNPAKANYETERAKVLKKGLARNQNQN